MHARELVHKLLVVNVGSLGLAAGIREQSDTEGEVAVVGRVCRGGVDDTNGGNGFSEWFTGDGIGREGLVEDGGVIAVGGSGRVGRVDKGTAGDDVEVGEGGGGEEKKGEDSFGNRMHIGGN